MHCTLCHKGRKGLDELAGKFVAHEFSVSRRQKGTEGGSGLCETKKMQEELERGGKALDGENWGAMALPRGARHVLPVRECDVDNTKKVMNSEPEPEGFKTEEGSRHGQWQPSCSVQSSRMRKGEIGLFVEKTRKGGTIGMPLSGLGAWIACESWTVHPKERSLGARKGGAHGSGGCEGAGEFLCECVEGWRESTSAGLRRVESQRGDEPGILEGKS